MIALELFVLKDLILPLLLKEIALPYQSVLSALLEWVLALRLDRLGVLKQVVMRQELLLPLIRALALLCDQLWLEGAGLFDLLLLLLDPFNGHYTILFSGEFHALVIEPVENTRWVIG